MKEKMFCLKIDLLRKGKLSVAAKETGIRLSRLSRILNGWEEPRSVELEKIAVYLKSKTAK